jgi:phage I-like protein
VLPDSAHMTTKRASKFLAFMGSATELDGGIPEWLHLLPAGKIQTHDGVNDFQWDGAALKMCSFFGDAEESRIPVDINHSNSKLGTQGQDTPAQGWIVELAIKPDGVWGRTEWNDSGKAALANKSYRGISPELMVDKKTRKVTGIRGASLTNYPNLKGLVPILNSLDTTEEDDFDMDKLLKDLLAKLGLAADATQDAALQSISELVKGKADFKAFLQSVAKASGAAETATHEVVLQSITTALAAKGSDEKVVTALRAEMAEMTVKMNSVTGTVAKDKATAFVDGEIRKGRVGVSKLREHYIEMHMADPTRVEKEFAAMPILNGVMLAPEPPADGSVVLSEVEALVSKNLGIDPEVYKKTKAAHQAAAQ